MPRYRNVDPQGDVVIPTLGGRLVRAGEEIDVTDPEIIASLEAQHTWLAVDQAATAAKEA